MNMTNFPVFIDIEFAFRRLIILPLRLPLQSLFAPLFAPSFCRACLGCEIQALKRNHDFATLTSIDDYSFLVKSPHMAERREVVFLGAFNFLTEFLNYLFCIIYKYIERYQALRLKHFLFPYGNMVR